MAEESVPVCFICLQVSSDAVPIMEDAGTNQNEPSKPSSEAFSRGSVISKHFWFMMEDLLGASICCNCWSKIDDFHQFYCAIEETHEQKLHFSISCVKDEYEEYVAPETDQGSQEALHYTTADDHQDYFDSIVEKNDDEKAVTCSINEQSVTVIDTKLAKLRKRRKKPKPVARIARNDELIAKYCNMHCDQCSLEYTNFRELQKHSALVHQTRAYVFCCDRKFNNRTRLFEHIQRHLNPERFQCDLCKRMCVDSESLKRHKLKIHTPVNERQFKCDMCPKAFVSKITLATHRNYHLALETKEYPCQHCDRFFGNVSLLRAHEKNQHASTFEYVCDTCAKGFNQRGPFLRHLQEHGPKAPEEKVQCPICSRWLLKVSMNKHIVRHNSPSYRCDLCGKESPNVLAHKSHMRFAHTDAKFACTICDKVFKRALALKEHIAAHSGESLYTCPYCPKTFNSNANMHAHRKKMHHQEWLETKMKRFAKHE
ncbi:transcription factor grauzone-like [Toxorhynchites rutilus septentrionalis]|uniref:transcription factor grauzone-like n=1 Tax=Toxorhynchites rutilus septentrionalis TaxID=329112 RepID=UPI002479B501|nr:transcription factor grauzone-like [Toxorhynchites rutilus septentrionalis]XP_055634012.1 transcription factor grauzone-like [Toxorhynchites rutilus septentrionalis]